MKIVETNTVEYRFTLTKDEFDDIQRELKYVVDKEATQYSTNVPALFGLLTEMTEL